MVFYIGILTAGTALFIMTLEVATQTCSVNLSSKCQCETDKSDDSYVSCYYENGTVIEFIIQRNKNVGQVKLTYLNISYTEITDLPDDYFSQIYFVGTVNLSHNYFQSMPKALSLINKISKLDISFNIISTNDFSPIQGKHVTVLNMADNALTHLQRENFQNLKWLEEVNFSGNNISYVDDSCFQLVQRLRILILSRNNLQFVSTKMFDGISKSLQLLDLSDNRILDIEASTFISIYSLKVLNLSQNQKIHSLDTMEFPPHLSYLNARATGLEHLDKCIFAKLTDLEFLDIEDNNLTCSCDLLQLVKYIDQNHVAKFFHVHSMPIYMCNNQSDISIFIQDINLNCDEYNIENLLTECHQNNFVEVKGQFSQKQDLDLHVHLKNEEIKVSWQPVMWTKMYGYRITINEENGNRVHQSDIIHKTTTTFLFRDSSLTAGDFSVCLNVLLNETYILQHTCHPVTAPYTQIVLGIVAGTAFLLPCLAIFILVIIKDRKMSQKQDCEQLIPEKTTKVALNNQTESETMCFDNPLKPNTEEMNHENVTMATNKSDVGELPTVTYLMLLTKQEAEQSKNKDCEEISSVECKKQDNPCIT